MSSRSSARARGARRLPPEARLGLGLLVALALVYSATPLAIRVADRLQFYDKPAGYKGHARPTPYLGGSAVMVGFLLALFVVSVADWDRTLPLVGGMAVLWGGGPLGDPPKRSPRPRGAVRGRGAGGVVGPVGPADDRHNVSPGLRVAFEVVVAAVLWQAGLGWDLGLGAGVDLVLTVAWVVGVVNAFNLFDNMDGAASTMALVVSACAAVLGLLHGDNWLAVAAATLCGACLGFLPHNLASPARIFLGDGGSMPIGFGVAALVMIGAAEAAPASQALVVGVLLVGIPALDTCLVILSRRRRGISILTGGRDHLTHRTHRSLGTARAVAMSLGAVQALVAALALFALRGGATTIVLIVVLYFVAAATAIALLEAVERERERMSAEALPGLAVAASAPKSGLSARRTAVCALVGVAGVAAGASAFSSGYYSPGQWVPIGLLLLVVAIAAAIARSARLSRPALVALFSLGGLGVWALLSSAWAPSIEQATIDANRQIVLAAMFATAVVLVRNQLLAAWLTGGIFAGLAAVTVWVLWRLAFDAVPGDLLQSGRLNGPLGYVNGMGMVFLMGFWLCFSLVERRSALLSSVGIGGGALVGLVGGPPPPRAA